MPLHQLSLCGDFEYAVFHTTDNIEVAVFGPLQIPIGNIKQVADLVTLNDLTGQYIYLSNPVFERSARHIVLNHKKCSAWNMISTAHHVAVAKRGKQCIQHNT